MDRDKARQFVDRFVSYAAGATTIGLLAVADRTGLLATLRTSAPASADGLAEAAGLDSRYTLEILRGLVAAGALDYHADGELFSLSPEHAAVLADDTSPYTMAGWLDMIPTVFGHMDAIVDATRTGGGVSFEEFGDRMVVGIDRGNRASVSILLARRWLAAMPDVVERLTDGGRIADLGCGSGSAVAAMAHAFPAATVTGFDISEASINRARQSTDAHNASFVVGDSAALIADGPYDLVTALDVVHDLADPLEAVRNIKQALAPGGVFLMMEPRIDAKVENNVSDRGALLYGISTFHCMTQSLAAGGAGLGAAWGPEQAHQLCRDAGFDRFEELPIENPFSAFFRVE
jgi:2-polyprenyl-3-methyl-5-hydroxy-6-metoxy-1,4-benzoquinol methylase